MKTKEELSAYNAKYYQEHRDEIRTRKKRLYNKDIAIARKKAWLEREGNREKWNAYMRERRRKAKIDNEK